MRKRAKDTHQSGFALEMVPTEYEMNFSDWNGTDEMNENNCKIYFDPVHPEDVLDTTLKYRV